MPQRRLQESKHPWTASARNCDSTGLRPGLTRRPGEQGGDVALSDALEPNWRVSTLLTSPQQASTTKSKEMVLKDKALFNGARTIQEIL